MPEDQPQIPPAARPSEPQSTTTPETTEAQPVKKATYGGQVFLGILSCWLLLPGTVGLVVGIGGALTAPPFILLAGVSLIPLGLGAAVIAGRRKLGPGLGVGFLIGLALLGLAIGLCFASFR
jgi:hypothetical protein